MRDMLATIGTAAVLLWVMGTLDVIDFKFCITPAGTCSIEVRK